MERHPYRTAPPREVPVRPRTRDPFRYALIVLGSWALLRVLVSPAEQIAPTEALLGLAALTIVSRSLAQDAARGVSRPQPRH